MNFPWWAAVIVGAAVSLWTYAASMLTPLPSPYPEILMGLCALVIIATGTVGVVLRQRQLRWISCPDAIDWMLDRSRWGKAVPRDGFELERAAMAFDQAAREGRIATRGRRQHLAVVDPIPDTYWQTGGLDTLGLMADPPRAATEDKTGVAGFVAYQDIEVPEWQVRQCWPRPLSLFG